MHRSRADEVREMRPLPATGIAGKGFCFRGRGSRTDPAGNAKNPLRPEGVGPPTCGPEDRGSLPGTETAGPTPAA